MATVIKVKNSGVSGSPTSLAVGEFAYSFLAGDLSNGGDRLYIGTGAETGGVADNIEVIGGKYFTQMLDHTKGILTPNSALIVDADGKLSALKVDDIQLDGNTISSTVTNQDLILAANGTGDIVFNSPVVIGSGININDLGVTGTATINDLDATSLAVSNLGAGAIPYTTTGGQLVSNSSLTYDGSSFVLNGQMNVDNLRLDGNTLSATNTDGDVTIATPGVGKVVMQGTQGVVVPAGTLAQRPVGTGGMIRYTTSTNKLEWHNGTAWKDVSGVVDADGDTYITAQDSDVADNDELDFFTAGVKRLTIGAAGVEVVDSAAPFKVGALSMLNDTISSTGDITLDPTGDVIIEGNLQINGTTTTVNSTEITVDDPVLTLGGDTAPVADDNKDRGIQFRYYDTQSRVGFMGWDDSNTAFTFLEDATNTNEVFSGTLADVRMGRATVDGLDFSSYSNNGVLFADAGGMMQFAASGVEGHVLQTDAAGVPFFGILDGGTY
jgi:hypothetical protein